MIGPDLGELDSCKKLIDEFGLHKNIEILGHIDQSKLVNYFHENDIYLNTTSYESFGNALCEAASCGIPIISSSVGEIPYIWKHKCNILLSDKLNAAKFTEMVEKLIKNEELRKSIILNAKKNIKKFDKKIILKSWTDLLTTI